jgi:hypothetical protein
VEKKAVHWSDRKSTGNLPWTLDHSTASSEEWIVDADGVPIGFVCFVHRRDRKTFLDKMNK